MDEKSQPSEGDAPEETAPEAVDPAYKAAFENRARKRRGESSEANPPASDDDSDSKPQPEADPRASDDASGSGEEPPPEGEGNDDSPDKDSSATGTAATEPSDLEKEVERLRQRDAEREKELSDLRSEVGRAKKREKAKPEPPPLDESLTQEADQALEEVRDWDPDTAGKIEAERKALRERSTTAPEPEESEEDKQARLAAEAGIVEAKHPGWRETQKTAEFQDWMKEQPSYTRRVWDESESGAEVSEILSSYEGHRASEREAREKESKRLEKRKETSATLPSSKPSGAHPVEEHESADDAFKRSFDRRRRERAKTR